MFMLQVAPVQDIAKVAETGISPGAKVWLLDVMYMLLFVINGDVYVTGCAYPERFRSRRSRRPGHCKNRRKRNQPQRQGMVIELIVYSLFFVNGVVYVTGCSYPELFRYRRSRRQTYSQCLR